MNSNKNYNNNQGNNNNALNNNRNNSSNDIFNNGMLKSKSNITFSGNIFSINITSCVWKSSMNKFK